jgi:hypothetical protein
MKKINCIIIYVSFFTDMFSFSMFSLYLEPHQIVKD